MNLSEAEKATLLNLARTTIEKWLDPSLHVKGQESGEQSSGALTERCGAFVSLYVEGKLRGCIGTFSEENPLRENIRNMALSAATSDDRFSPISADELDRLSIEISVLSPRERVNDYRKIIPGKHGIYMVSGANRGTFLPQVALQQNWTLEEFLGNCARYKAGIGWDGWKSAELYTYTATVFHSEEDGSNR
ncbi:MAG: AmmeMemoRadiSam system protein A [Bacteroidales bacterium]